MGDLKCSYYLGSCEIFPALISVNSLTGDVRFSPGKGKNPTAISKRLTPETKRVKICYAGESIR